MDIEWYTAMKDHQAESTEQADMRAIIDCEKDVFQGIGIEVLDEDILLTTASREDKDDLWKSSFHVTFRCTYFENVDVMSAFVREKLQPECVRRELVRFNPKKNKPESMIDFVVYNKNRLMRCALSKHAHKNTTLEKIDWYGTSKHIEDYLITVQPTGSVALITRELLEQHGIKVGHKNKSAHGRKTSTLESTAAIACKLQALLKEKLGDELSSVGEEKEPFNGTRSFYCHTNGHRICPQNKRHESNNFYLRVDGEGTVKCHCLACQKTTEIALKMATASHPWRASRTRLLRAQKKPWRRTRKGTMTISSPSTPAQPNGTRLTGWRGTRSTRSAS